MNIQYETKSDTVKLRMQLGICSISPSTSYVAVRIRTFWFRLAQLTDNAERVSRTAGLNGEIMICIWGGNFEIKYEKRLCPLQFRSSVGP